MFADLPRAVPASVRMEALREEAVDKYTATILDRLHTLGTTQWKSPSVRFDYAFVDFKEGFFPGDGYVPGDSRDDFWVCVHNPEDYTDYLTPRLLGMGLHATTFDKEISSSGNGAHYYVTLDNPYTHPRIPYTNPAFWEVYDRDLASDLDRLARVVRERLLSGRSTFSLETKPVFSPNLDRIKRELGPKNYVCRIREKPPGSYMMYISPPE